MKKFEKDTHAFWRAMDDVSKRLNKIKSTSVLLAVVHTQFLEHVRLMAGDGDPLAEYDRVVKELRIILANNVAMETRAATEAMLRQVELRRDIEAIGKWQQ